MGGYWLDFFFFFLVSKSANIKLGIFAPCITTGTEFHVLFHWKSQSLHLPIVLTIQSNNSVLLSLFLDNLCEFGFMLSMNFAFG